MKNLFLLFIAFLLLQFNTLAQEGWFEQTSGTTEHLNSIHFIDNNTGWAVGTEGIILNTTDGGTNWYPQTSGTTEWLYSVHFANDTTGWAVGGVGTILKTTDGGTIWTPQTSGTSLWLNSVHFANDTTGWVVGNGFGNPLRIILKTTDGGINWIPQTSGTTEHLNSIHFIDNNTGWAVGTEGTILYTTNGGEKWCSQTSGTIETLTSVYFTDSNTGWAVGYNGTILKTTNGGVSFVEEEEIDEIPTGYSLTQNFPNPFNPSTKIRYSVPQSSRIVIKVFDLLGNEIETLVNEEKVVGTYELTWYAESATGGLPSGVYFYQLRAGDYIAMKKMILLK